MNRLFPLFAAASLTLLATLPAHAQFSHIGIGQDIPACKEGGMAMGKCIEGIEKKALALADGKVVRKEGVLEMSLPGKMVVLKNNDAEGKDFIDYTYLGYEETLRQHVVYVGFHQGDQFWTYHGKTGQQNKMHGYPLLAPDKQHFATWSVDMLAGFNPNLVEIWQVGGGQISKVASFKGDKWGPDGVEWQANGELLVKKVCNSTGGENQPPFVPCGSLKIANGKAGWAIVP